jgi:hypothetical protein
MLRLLLVCALVASPGAAGADDDPRARADELVRQGNQLAQAGKLTEAIAAFKQAEQLHPRAVPPGNAGLAYGKLGKPALAHLYLRRCRERWTATEARAAPAWIDAELARLDKVLAAATSCPGATATILLGARATALALAPDPLVRHRRGRQRALLGARGWPASWATATAPTSATTSRR